MSMTGGISFFEKNKTLYEDGGRCVASSNTADQNLPLGTNKYFTWESSGSDDTTTETLTITLPESVEISRIFLIGHNFKQFQIKYGAAQNFAGVTGLDAYSGALISETTFARDAAYYEFTPVTTDTVTITIDKTQTVDAEKEINQIIITNEIGTLVGYPKITGAKFDRDDRTDQSVSGRSHVEKGYETSSFGLDLSSYPGQADINILEGLHDRNEAFLVWLNGGVPDNFTYTQRGFRVGDVYQMQTVGGLPTGYYKNIYPAAVEQSYRFLEVV